MGELVGGSQLLYDMAMFRQLSRTLVVPRDVERNQPTEMYSARVGDESQDPSDCIEAIRRPRNQRIGKGRKTFLWFDIPPKESV